MDPFFIRAHGSETHARRADHLAIVVLLRETPPVVVSLRHGLDGHLGENIEQGLISVTNLIGFLIDLHLG